MAYLYCHFKEDTNEPFYVGIGRKLKRAYNLAHHSRTDFHRNIVKKHGIRIEILLSNISWETACFWEICWIKALKNAGHNIANLTSGGEGVHGVPAHNRKKVVCLETGELFDSATHAAIHFNLSPATVTDVCKLKYRSAKDYHFVFSADLIDELDRVKMIREIEIKCAARRKMVAVNKNRDELVSNGVDKIGRSAAGPMKISRRVICIEDGKIYPSASAAARFYNVAKSAVIELCLGKNNRKTVGGYKFKYVEEEA